MQNHVTGLFKFTQLTLAVALLGVTVAAATESDMYKGYELPPYDVIVADGDLELRRYEPHILAEVTVKGSQSSAIGRGFQVLANYIFGGNAAGEKIEMTVPVSQSAAPRVEGGWTVSFMMPGSFDLATLPQAKSEAIRFVETPREELLVVKFSGFRSGSSLSARTSEIVSEAERRGLQITGAPRYFFYDGPMTPPWARRNEVAIPVKRTDV